MLNMKQEERMMKKNNSITHTHKRKKKQEIRTTKKSLQKGKAEQNDHKQFQLEKMDKKIN